MEQMENSEVLPKPNDQPRPKKPMTIPQMEERLSSFEKRIEEAKTAFQKILPKQK